MSGELGELQLFADEKEPSTHLSVMPVSVIDIMAQGKRKNENHASTSSRDNYSPFPNEIATLCCEFFLRDATAIFDPFAGWGERHATALKFGKKYIGFDTSQEAIDKAFEDYGVINQLGNVLNGKPLPCFDGLLTCPPYWNLEKYESDFGLDREKTWDSFIKRLFTVFSRCYDAALPNTTFCIMVGDWRKNHVYYDLEWQVSNIFNNLGAQIVDKVVVSRSKVSKIKIMLPQAKRLGYTVRVHESLLVFRKGA